MYLERASFFLPFNYALGPRLTVKIRPLRSNFDCFRFGSSVSNRKMSVMGMLQQPSRPSCHLASRRSEISRQNGWKDNLPDGQLTRFVCILLGNLW